MSGIQSCNNELQYVMYASQTPAILMSVLPCDINQSTKRSFFPIVDYIGCIYENQYLEEMFKVMW